MSSEQKVDRKTVLGLLEKAAYPFESRAVRIGGDGRVSVRIDFNYEDRTKPYHDSYTAFKNSILAKAPEFKRVAFEAGYDIAYLDLDSNFGSHNSHDFKVVFTISPRDHEAEERAAQRAQEQARQREIEAQENAAMQAFWAAKNYGPLNSKCWISVEDYLHLERWFQFFGVGVFIERDGGKKYIVAPDAHSPKKQNEVLLITKAYAPATSYCNGIALVNRYDRLGIDVFMVDDQPVFSAGQPTWIFSSIGDRIRVEIPVGIDQDNPVRDWYFSKVEAEARISYDYDAERDPITKHPPQIISGKVHWYGANGSPEEAQKFIQALAVAHGLAQAFDSNNELLRIMTWASEA